MSKLKNNHPIQSAILDSLAAYGMSTIGRYAKSTIDSAMSDVSKNKMVNPIVRQMRAKISRRDEKKKKNRPNMPYSKLVSPPVSIGTCINDAAMFRRGGKPLANADYQVGERFVGRMLSSDLKTTAALPNSPFTTYATDASTIAWYNYHYPLSPKSIGGRVALEAQNWQYYAFRKFAVRYVPRVGTSTAGAFAIGMNRNVITSSNASLFTVAPSFSAIAQFSPSFMTPVWEICSLVDTHYGSRLWSTVTNVSSTSNDLGSVLASYQHELYGYTDYGTTGTTFGNLIFEFEIDFYGPSLPIATSSLTKDSLLPKPELKREETLPISTPSASNPPRMTAIAERQAGFSDDQKVSESLINTLTRALSPSRGAPRSSL